MLGTLSTRRHMELIEVLTRLFMPLADAVLARQAQILALLKLVRLIVNVVLPGGPK